MVRMSQVGITAGELFGRVGFRCPLGFCLGVVNGRTVISDTGHRIVVADGATIEVVCVPAGRTISQSSYDSEDSDPADNVPNDSGSNGSSRFTGGARDTADNRSSTGGTRAPEQQSDVSSRGSERQHGQSVSHPAHRDMQCRKTHMKSRRNGITLGHSRNVVIVAASLQIVTATSGDNTRGQNCVSGAPTCTGFRPIPTPCRASASFLPRQSSVPGPRGHPVSEVRTQISLGRRPRVTLTLADRIATPEGRGLISWPSGLHLPDRDESAHLVLGHEYDMPLVYGQVSLGFTPRQLHELFRPVFSSLSVREWLARGLGPRRTDLARLAQNSGDSLPNGVTCFTDGSFIPAEGEEPERTGWSCIFVNKENRTCDILAGALPDWCLDGNCPSAFKAECCAIIVGLWLGISAGGGKRIAIASDCQAALGIAEGKTAARVPGVAQILEHVAQCCRDAAIQSPEFWYTPGHKNVLGNELADIAAKTAANGHSLGFLSWSRDKYIDWWSRQGVSWAWAGLVCRWAKGDDALPSPLGHALSAERNMQGLSCDETVGPFLPSVTDVPIQLAGNLSMRVASYNALSLATERKGATHEGLAFQPARPVLLSEQLDAAGVSCAAIQEARTEEGKLNTGPFLRFCSGSNKGHFGVELWFRRSFPLVSFGDERKACITFDPAAFVVLHKDPRRIVVLFKQGSCRIVFASLHAPHRGTDPAELQEWWESTESLLYRASRGSLLIIGADCNAKLGSVESKWVGNAGAEEQDLAGDCLHSCLGKCEIWAPSTWPGVHQGAHWTFAQRRNGTVTRADYVLLPLAWQSSLVASWTDPSIVAANLVIDHVAAIVNVDAKLFCEHVPARAKRARIDVAALSKPENRHRLEEVFKTIPRPHWNVSAHAHVAIVTKHLQEGLQAAFPLEAKRPMHPYLSQTAWELQQQVAWLSKRCVKTRTAMRRSILAGVFYAWRDVRPQTCLPQHGSERRRLQRPSMASG